MHDLIYMWNHKKAEFKQRVEWWLLRGQTRNNLFSQSSGYCKSKIKVSAALLSGESSLPSLQMATFFLLCPRKGFSLCTLMERANSLLPLCPLFPSNQDPTLTTSFRLNYSLKVLSSNTITLRVWASKYKFGETHLVHRSPILDLFPGFSQTKPHQISEAKNPIHIAHTEECSDPEQVKRVENISGEARKLPLQQVERISK